MTYPFYKTSNQNIFKNLNDDKVYDLIWVCNNKQITQKGQEFFISKVGKYSFLKQLKILHVGNKPDVGKLLCKKYDVDNIIFNGPTNRQGLNSLINKAKIGIITSNKQDGCPRVSTEILKTGTPLIVRNITRLLEYYKDDSSVYIFKDDEIINVINKCIINYEKSKEIALNNIEVKLSTENVCKKNLEEWYK